jgi:hypothetical protein
MSQNKVLFQIGGLGEEEEMEKKNKEERITARFDFAVYLHRGERVQVISKVEKSDSEEAQKPKNRFPTIFLPNFFPTLTSSLRPSLYIHHPPSFFFFLSSASVQCC